MPKVKMIPNWRQGWRFWSTRLQILGLAFLGLFMEFPDAALSVWVALPPDLKDYLPPQFARYIAYAIFFASIVARFIRQDGLDQRGPVSGRDRPDKGKGNRMV